KSTQNKSTQNKSTQNKSTKNKSTQNKSDKNKGNGSTAKKTKEEVKEDVQKAEQENPTQAPDLYNIYWDNMLLDLYDNNYNSEAEKDLLENLDVQQLSTENTIGQQLNSININHIEKELNFDPLENLLINGQSGQKNGLWGNDFSIRDWGIKDYLNERGAFQKGLGSMLGEPTWFYFKIFFKFNTNFGLFGNIMRGDVPRRDNTSAERYLSNIRTRYYQEQPANRRNALIKFVRTLSYINCKAPWMFFSVKDLHNALVYDLSKAGAPKAITLEFMQEAIDMRLTTLFDLYRYAAYDFAHDKEVIPENLRKFEMDIVLFQVPIKRLQTAMKTLTNRKAFYKSFSPNINYGETLSYQLFSFQNCEFDINSFSSLIPSSINNDKPFGLKPSIKINYDRCYHHTFNEFTQFLIGDSRYLYIGYGEDQLNLANNDDKKGSSPPPESQLAKLRGDNSFVEGSQQNRIKMLQYGMDNANIHNETSNNYAALIEASEDIIGESLRMISPKIALGNIYQQNGWNDIWKNYGDLAANTWDKFAKQWKFSKTDFEDYLGITRKDHQKTIDETVKPPTKDSESIKRPNPYNPDDIRKQWEEDAKNWKQTEENKIKNLYRLMHHSDYGEDCTPKYTP
ncbi:MAG: hypothetical protein J1F35_03465, partial [Erysipelotrichales bacterium]|nr:hypothetical protein [Erysipelotrichales bacterium]